MSRRILFAGSLAALVALAGCHTCCRQPITSARPPCAPCGDGFTPSRFAPAPAPVPAAPRFPRSQPPIARNDGPEQAGFLQPAPREFPPEPRDLTPAPPRAAVPNPLETQPDPLRPDDVGDDPPRVRVLPPRRSESRQPETNEPPKNNLPGNPAPRVDEYSERKEEKPKDPVDVPGYQPVFANVATGQKPFAEGLKWLRARGFNVILHIAPEDDKEVDPKEIEDAGFRYLKMTITPRSLTKEAFDDFVKAVNDIRDQPIYVMDKDSSLVGGLWYLYFRIHKRESDARSRTLATKYGFRFNDDLMSSHKEMEIAIQKLLAELIKK